ncbi:Uncharacterised protein g2023 [Pycnogonum litorale]
MNQLCKVCGEPAAGFHFGAFTCEGCKSFFGRTYNNLSSLSDCKNSGRCVINKKNRTSCKSCRLRKCLMVGMSKSGSRYGRRSNWFKIHCLLQDQGSANMASDTASLLGNHHQMLSPPPTSSATYEISRDVKRNHYSPALVDTERTSSASPGGEDDSSSELESKIANDDDDFRGNIYGGIDTPSPPYERTSLTHHLPMSPVSPMSPHAHFVYNSNNAPSPNSVFHNGLKIKHRHHHHHHHRHHHNNNHNEYQRHFIPSYISVGSYEAMLKPRIVNSSGESPPCLRRLKKEYDSDDTASSCGRFASAAAAATTTISQEKPIDLSLRSNGTSPATNEFSSIPSDDPDLDSHPPDSPESVMPDAPLDLTRKT